jgi:mono/diheme cytochrome c family protein
MTRTTCRPAGWLTVALLASVFVLAATACVGTIEGNASPDGEPLPPVAPSDPDDLPGGDEPLTEDADLGGELYVELCTSCHGSNGLGGALASPLTRDIPVAELIDFIDQQMPKDDPSKCDRTCAQRVAAYIREAFVKPNLPPDVPPGSPPPTGEPTDPDLFNTGRELYAAKCSNCHGADGLGGPFNVPLTRNVAIATLANTISTTMPKGQVGSCDAACGTALATYIRAAFVTPEQPQEPPQTPPPPVMEPGQPPQTCGDERPGPRQLRLLTRREYANTVRDLLGVDVVTDNLPVEPRVKGFDNNAAAMVVTARHMDTFLALAEDAATRAVSQQRARILRCTPGAADCPRQFVSELGLRAFRRPLTDEEITAFAAPFAGNGFDDAMRIVVAGMMISPSFLYRWEIGRLAGGVSVLTPYEVASQLSYLFLGSMPDNELFIAAQNNRLATSEEITAHARRLLATARARTQVSDFATQWLRTEEVLGTNKDATIYPAFTPAIRQAMIEEQNRFVLDTIFESRGSYQDLFLADYVFANGALAQYYGLPSPGTNFTKVPVDTSTGRGGLLGLGTVLAAHAHSNESSPVKRGVFVRGRLLCQDLPPPPPDLDATPPGLDPTLTTRERFAVHSSDPACRSCHQYIDGVGFSFEGFDGAGQRRTTENGLPIDTSGELVGLEGLGNASSVDYDGVRELAEMVADSNSGRACLPLQYFRFARGYEERTTDACAINNLRAAFVRADLNLQELLVAITSLPTFTQRAAN